MNINEIAAGDTIWWIDDSSGDASEWSIEEDRVRRVNSFNRWVSLERVNLQLNRDYVFLTFEDAKVNLLDTLKARVKSLNDRIIVLEND